MSDHLRVALIVHCCLLCFQWEGDLNKTKNTVKNDIEEMVAKWTREEKDRCLDQTAEAFQGGGMINSHLSGGQSPH